ncbi:class I adenylate-forming enzyme family protein [Limnohabitans radicicola]|uniref:Acyl--CoA ligase n=1 Tax=Limnohabitans radicicola TaxID=2771427 RepID=A0A927IIY6_9BURK|nr:class I adenylate-forming enzyme family protein [Limnohabitans radicicola]MBD8050119.1 acyl--CoA ligase [Limnohabitans radicicola]
MSHTRIHQLFDERAAQAPDHPFLFLRDGVMTLGQLAVQVDALEAELREAGVRLGDRVLVAAENCPEHVALVLACSRVGAWACGVNARMTASELAGFAAKADARLLYFTVGVSEAARHHAAQHDTRPSVLLALRHTLADPQAVAQTGELAERVAAIIFTSGTTGQPKGVMLTHAGLLQFGKVSAQSRQLLPTDRSYAYLPMTHIFGLGTVLMASLHAGAGLLMRSQFDPADVFDALAHQGLTQLQGPPAMFTRLLAWLDSQGIEHPEAPDLRYVYTGAAPLDLSVKKAIEARFGQPLHHGYGLSEYAGALTLCRKGEWRDDTSAGYLVDGAELRIVGPNGQDLSAGETGEIWMRGVGLMPGYFRDPEITDQVMKPGGWYASGDLGRQDADGALQVVGRLKEMIIRSGFNVYPGEVEAVFLAWPGVQKAAVAGRKTADGNEDILAFIEPKPGAHIDLDALKAHAHEHLSPYKRPSVVTLVAEMPMTLSGKVLKRELVEKYAQP